MKLFSTNFRNRPFLPLLLAGFLICLPVCGSAVFAQSPSPVPKEVAAPKEPLSLDNIFRALRSEKAPLAQRNQLLMQGVKMRGISFVMTDEVEAELTNQGAAKTLIELIRQETKRFQETPFYYRERADDFRLRRNYDAAIDYYNKTLELDPNDRAAYNNRGHVYQELKKYDEAIADFTKVIEIDPSDRNGYQNRGVVYYYKNEFQKAIDDYTQAIEIDATFADAYLNRSHAYQMMGRRDLAEADRRRAQELKR